ncbi:hypothetical protein PVAP13_2NG283303 [Panicum virgatum]|uniref:Uncharacterized protein n=1 Tax=Panicum virgatum TaxID=38727 RepID=A0A8T0V9D9_PANVG|nr:hypothetical protein PVAP13_2NG283303 [Panicum virgatum]
MAIVTTEPRSPPPVTTPSPPPRPPYRRWAPPCEVLHIGRGRPDLRQLDRGRPHLRHIGRGRRDPWRRLLL